MPVERRLNVIQKVYETNCFTTRKPVPCRPFEKGQITGFPEKVIKGTKIHTFREDPGKWAYNVELINSHDAELSIRRWIGRPYHTPQLEVKRLKKIGIQQVQMTWESTSSSRPFS